MTANLSPERYLNLPVPVRSPRSRSLDGNDHRPNPRPAVMMWPLGSFSGLDPSFWSWLGGLRYKTFAVDVDDLCESDSVSKKYLQPVLDVCNRDFLASGTPPLTISLDQRAFGSVTCEIGSLVIDRSDQCGKKLTWCPPSRRFNWDYHKKCFCVLVLADPGTIPHEDFMGPTPITLESTPIMECSMSELLDRCQRQNAAFGIISDEVWSVVLDNRDGFDSGRHSIEIFSNNEIPLRMTLGAAVYNELLKSDIFHEFGTYGFWPCVGALNNPATPAELLQSMLQTRRSFSDFDLYTLQRNYKEWHKFCVWKRTVEADHRRSPLRSGDVLGLEVNGFRRRHSVWRSPNPSHPIPTETREIVTRAPRPRDNAVDGLLACEGGLTFKILEAKRTGPNHYSQVYFGRLGDLENLVCLKLFEERLFSRPDASSWDPEISPAHRLLTFNFAVDLVRREEAVYEHRLKYLQGSLLPHCYGFHVFTLPDGWEVLGLLMEVIEGPSLYECGFQTWSEDDRKDFLTRLRHGVKAMKFAGIVQTDWHLDQVLCPVNAKNPTNAPEIVFIDFAFAVQDMGENEYIPSTDDAAMLYIVLMSSLGVEESMLDTCWFERVEEEY